MPFFRRSIGCVVAYGWLTAVTCNVHAKSPPAAEATPSPATQPSAEDDAPPPSLSLQPGDAANDEASEDTLAEAPAEPAPTTLACSDLSPNDALYPVVSALSALRTGRVRIEPCRIVDPEGRARALEAEIVGEGQDLLLYILEGLSGTGFWIELAPTGKHRLSASIRPSRGLGRGIRYTNLDKLTIHGRFLAGDSPRRLSNIIGIQHQIRHQPFDPIGLQASLRNLGYRAIFYPVAPREVVIEVSPGRSIRRVRLHGNLPIPGRDLLSQLSLDAKPGALARGRCVAPARLRRARARPPVCDASDVACRQWEANQISRMRSFLFDRGYFHAQVELGLACGRARDEASLHVFIDKGPAVRVARRGVRVHAAQQQLTPGERRQIERDFMPRVLWFFRRPLTRAFVQEARESVQRNYAEPSTGLRPSGRPLHRNYPEISVETSYDDLSAKDPDLPKTRNIDLEVRVDLGRAVEARFEPEARPTSVPAGRWRTRLRFGASQLIRQLQLFQRREPPSAATARREAANLRAYYQSKGHLLARVEGRFEDYGGLGILKFRIGEGPRIRIRALEIVPPQGVPAELFDQIRAVWLDRRQLRKRGFLSDSSALTDITLLHEQLQSAGYLCAHLELRVAFWPKGFETSNASARLTAQRLVQSGGRASWLEDLDPAGLEALMGEAKADAYVQIHIEPGPRVVTSATEYVHHLARPIDASRGFEGNTRIHRGIHWGARRILHDTPLRHRGSDTPGGVAINFDLDRELPATIAKRYRDSGFPVADAELTWIYRPREGDTMRVLDVRELIESQQGICAARADDANVELIPIVSVYEGKRGSFGDILIRGNFKTQSWALRRELRFRSGQMYSRRLVDRSLSGIETLGVASRVGATPYPVACERAASGDCRVHHVIAIEESKDLLMDLRFGVGSATLNPFYVFARPSFPNVFGTAWNLDLEGRYGFDFGPWSRQGGLCDGASCFERSARGNLLRPQVFGSIVGLDIGGQYQRRVTPARGSIESISAAARISVPIAARWNLYFGYRFQIANVGRDLVKPLAGDVTQWTNRSTTTVRDQTGLIESGAVWANLDKPFNPDAGYLANIDLMLASPWLAGRDWWARFDLSWQHFLPIPRTRERLNLRYALRYGQIIPFRRLGTRTAPDVWRYYGGGSFDLGIRGILPETMLTDLEIIELPFGGRLLRPRAQGGHIRAIGTLALQVVSVKDFIGGKLAHSIFYDFGLMGQFWRNISPADAFRHSVGVNAIKWNINIVTLSLGYAVLLPPNIFPTDDRNGRFVFDVGITF